MSLYGMLSRTHVVNVVAGSALARGDVGHEVVVHDGVELGVVRDEDSQEWLTCGRTVATLRLVLVVVGRRCRI